MRFYTDISETQTSSNINNDYLVSKSGMGSVAEKTANTLPYFLSLSIYFTAVLYYLVLGNVGSITQTRVLTYSLVYYHSTPTF